MNIEEMKNTGHPIGLGVWSKSTIEVTGAWLYDNYMSLQMAQVARHRGDPEAENLHHEVVQALGRAIAIIRIDDPTVPGIFYSFLNEEEREVFRERQSKLSD
jgi:hypothetical protein